ncbi:MAG: exosortase E/protease, VPEID-CTERM system [Deltaproteobacteria bacterium]|nr:exosortase E/protease, VPEID-CTERM system [Deltaproteobacteria bacterium]
MESPKDSEVTGSINSRGERLNKDRVVLGPAYRLLLICGLLLAEYLVVSFLFDARALIEIRGLGFILGNLGYVAPVIVLAAAATAVFQGSKLKLELKAISHRFAAPRRTWLWLLLQLLLYVGFLALTREFYRVVESDKSPPISWVIGWLATALCVFLTAIPVVLPVRALAPLLRAISSSLVVGAIAGVLAWLAGISSTYLWDYLGRATIELVGVVLRSFSPDVYLDPGDSIVGIAPFFVSIAPICSGFEGIGLITALLALYLFVFRRELRFPNVLLLLPAAAFFVWVLNIFRIALLIAIGRWISPAVALGGFHSKAGWVFFCAVALATMVLIRKSTLFSKQTADQEPEVQGEARAYNPTAALLVPLLAVIAASLVTGLFVTSGFELLYPIKVLAAAVALWFYREYYRPFTWSWSWTGPAVGIVVFAIWISLVDGGDSRGLSRELFALPAWAAVLWIVFRVIGAALTVPVVEELAFRSYLLRRLISKEFDQVPKKRFSWLAFLLSSLAFGLLHQQVVAGTLAGLAYAYAQYHRGRTADAVVAHAVTNALIAAHVLIGGQWGLW